MKTPFLVHLALGGAVTLSTVGLCDQLGVLAAISSVSDWIAFLPLLLCVLVCGLIVGAGEIAKSKLLSWGGVATGLRRFVAFGGWGLFVAIAIFLSHQGLIAAERTILSPTVQPLEQALTRSTSDLDAALRAEASARQRIATQASDLSRNEQTAPTRSERMKAHNDLQALRDGEAVSMAPLEQATAAARAKLASDHAKRDAAPKGFMSLAISIPFLGSVALVSWLIPFAIEYLTGLVAWIAAPSPGSRNITHEDVLLLRPEGLELIDNLEALDQIGAKHSSLATKAGHIIKRRDPRFVRASKKIGAS